MRPRKALVGLAATALAVFGSAVVLASPALAGPQACTVSPPPGQHGASPASVTCPAGAGTFTFRVAAVCADAYPNLHLFDAEGPWVRAGQTAVTSSVPCHGAVPGSGFVWSAAIEVQ